MNLKPVIPFHDAMTASINNQSVYYGTSMQDLDPNRVYFVAIVDGTASVVFKDKNDNIMASLKEKSNTHFLRFDGGFKASSTSNFTLMYFWVAVSQ